MSEAVQSDSQVDGGGAPAGTSPSASQINGAGTSEGPATRAVPSARPRIDALDGLKALAILGVVLYHTRPPLLQGGFVGVTVFFVLTGFLTTRSVERALAHGTKFSPGRYLLHRLHKLWPPALAVIAGTIVLVALFAPWLLAKVHADALPATLFVDNWAYIVRQVPYFAAAGLPSPLTHFWFLGVYLQFIAIWTPLLALMRTHLKSRSTILKVTVVLALLSTVAMGTLFNLAGGDSTRAYYGTDTRAAELLVGAALALATQPGSTPAGPLGSTLVRRLLGIVGGAALVASLFVADGSSPVLYHGGYLALALATAAVVLCVTTLPQGWGARILGCRPLAEVGKRSLTIYLWHYPLLTVMNPATRTTALPWWGWVLEFVAIGLVSELTWRIFDQGWWPSLKRPRKAPRHASKTEASHARHMKTPPAKFRATPRYDAPQPLVVTPAIVVAIVSACVAGAVGLAPLDWDAIANPQAGGIHDRSLAQTAPDSQAAASETGATTDASATTTTAADAAATTDAATTEAAATSTEPPSPATAPFIDKVPANLDATRWSYDPATGKSDVNVLIVGDSVTDDARDAINHLMPNARVNAKTSRQITAGPDAYRESVEEGGEPDVVIVALGGNGVISQDSMVQNIIDAVGGKPLYFVTIRCPYPLQDSNNEVLRRFAAANDNVGIIDWYGASTGHDDWLVSDGQHLTGTGYQTYAHLLLTALVGNV